MIAQVSGTVVSLRLDAAVVAVGGVGLLVSATPGTLAGLRVGGGATLSTSLVVREDALTLFGFADDDARDTFELLQTVSGVGPRLALAVLAVHDPEGLRAAVAAEDVTALVRVPGIGRKGAQRILLELTDRLGPPRGRGAAPAAPVGTAGAPGERHGTVVEALVGLGWSARQAEDAVTAVTTVTTGGPDGPGGPPDDADTAAVLRRALRHLAR